MLYNTYRPNIFEDVIGQPAQKVLSNMAHKKRPAHSILLSGTRGVGKTTLGRVFGRALNCRSKTKPCGKCDSCLEVSHPDIREIDSTVSGNPSAIEHLQQTMYQLPVYQYNVFIFDEAHTITQKGMAVLLKVMEEPPKRTVIILLTTDPDKLDSALRSRCMWLPLRNLTKYEIMKILARVAIAEEMKISKAALSTLAEYANGSAREALSMLDVLSGFDKISNEVVELNIGRYVNVDNLLVAMLQKDYAEVLDEVSKLLLYNETRSILESLVDAVVKKIKEMLENKQPLESILDWVMILKKSLAEIKTATRPQIGLEVALIECLIKTVGVPPNGIVLKDWQTFTERVAAKQPRLAEQMLKMKFVRVKAGNIVVCKTNLRRVDEDKITKMIRSALHDENAQLEVLYA